MGRERDYHYKIALTSHKKGDTRKKLFEKAQTEVDDIKSKGGDAYWRYHGSGKAYVYVTKSTSGGKYYSKPTKPVTTIEKSTSQPSTYESKASGYGSIEVGKTPEATTVYVKKGEIPDTVSLSSGTTIVDTSKPVERTYTYTKPSEVKQDADRDTVSSRTIDSLPPVFSSILSRLPNVINILKSDLPPDQKSFEVKKKTSNDPYFYMLRHGDPKYTKELEPVFTRDKYSFLGLYNPVNQLRDFKRQLDYEENYMRAYESLSPEEKEVYGFRYTEWEDVPPQDIKYYEGGERYLGRLSEDEKEKMVEDYIESPDFKKYLKTPEGESEFSAILQDVQEKNMSETSKVDIFGFKVDVPTGRALSRGLQSGGYGTWPLWAGEETTAKERLATFRIFESDEQRKEKIFQSLGFPTRAYRSVAETGVSAVAYPITLPQTAIKYVTGEGNIFDFGGRVSTGDTLILPDVAEELGKRKVSPVQGVISGSIGEAFTWGESSFSDTATKYPVETLFASAGEIVGLWMGGHAYAKIKSGAMKSYDLFKTGMGKHGINIPSFPARYRPTNIIRNQYWKWRVKRGKAIELPPELPMKEGTLPSDLSYASGSNPTERIADMFKKFKESQSFDPITGEMYNVGIHTTTSPWLKPLVWMKKGRESAGVSFAPFGAGSPRFLRLSKISDYYYGSSAPTTFSLIPKLNLPTAPLLHFGKIKSIPTYLRNAPYKIIDKYIKKNTGVYVAPKMYKGGGEYEVIARGFALRQGVRYVTKIEGVYVPLPEFTLIGRGGLGFGQKIVSNPFVSNVREFVSPVSYMPSYNISLINPSYIGSLFNTAIPSRSSSSTSNKISIPSRPQTSYSGFKSSTGSSGIGSIISSGSGSGSSILSSIGSGFSGSGSGYSGSFGSGSSGSGSSSSITFGSSSVAFGSSYSPPVANYTPPINITIPKPWDEPPKRRKIKGKIKTIPKKYKYRQFKIKNILKDLGVDTF